MNTKEPIPRYWFDKNPFKTACANSLSVPVPHGERFVIRAARDAYPLIRDAALRERLDTLLHEEVAHSDVHDRYNALIRAQGCDITPYEEEMRRLYEWIDRHADIRTRLAVALISEYFAAITARHVVERIVFGPGTDARMKRLWEWHCLEELSHRSAVYDAYLHLGGGYFRRTLLLLLLLPFYSLAHTSCLLFLLAKNRKLEPYAAEAARAPGFLFGKNGFYTATLDGILAFFRPGFNPGTDFAVPERRIPHLHQHIEDEIIASLAA